MKTPKSRGKKLTPKIQVETNGLDVTIEDGLGTIEESLDNIFDMRIGDGELTLVEEIPNTNAVSRDDFGGFTIKLPELPEITEFEFDQNGMARLAFKNGDSAKNLMESILTEATQIYNAEADKTSHIALQARRLMMRANYAIPDLCIYHKEFVARRKADNGHEQQKLSYTKLERKTRWEARVAELANDTALEAFAIGRAYERLSLRAAEHFAAIGRASTKGGESKTFYVNPVWQWLNKEVPEWRDKSWKYCYDMAKVENKLGDLLIQDSFRKKFYRMRKVSH